MSIYISDLKKHHIIIYTFFNWFVKDSIFLRLSFFSFSVHLYFGLNTILIFNSSVSDAYYNTSNSSPIYIVMNLLLPFVICGLISFIIKINIMPQFRYGFAALGNARLLSSQLPVLFGHVALQTRHVGFQFLLSAAACNVCKHRHSYRSNNPNYQIYLHRCT